MEEKIFLENFERKKKAIGLIHKLYIAQLKNSRKYTASTKTKSEVRGGGRKPWRQKGTGNARAGSTRSPLWVGGGVIFGPKPRIVSKKINKKEKKLAILSAFYLKKNQFKFITNEFLKDLEQGEKKKTKKFLTMLSKISASETEKTLLILPEKSVSIEIMTKNLQNIELTLANSLNINQLLLSKSIILSTESFDIINATYGKIYN